MPHPQHGADDRESRAPAARHGKTIENAPRVDSVVALTTQRLLRNQNAGPSAPATLRALSSVSKMSSPSHAPAVHAIIDVANWRIESAQ
jgi:hypothetical protein